MLAASHILDGGDSLRYRFFRVAIDSPFHRVGCNAGPQSGRYGRPWSMCSGGLIVPSTRPLITEGHFASATLSTFMKRSSLFLQRHGAPGTDFSNLKLRADTSVQLVPRVLRGELHVVFGVMPILDKTFGWPGRP